MAASHFLTRTHHCAIFDGDDHGGREREFKNCKLHPGHEEFKTVDEYLNKTPSECGGKDDTEMSTVRNQIDRTVRVILHHTSVDRPDTFINSKNPYTCVDLRGNSCQIRFGTGYLIKSCNDGNNDKGDNDVTSCPCPECKTWTGQKPNRKSFYFVIVTATHVVFDKQEALTAKFEFFYDSEPEDTRRVNSLHGIDVLDTREFRLRTDECRVVCITHDARLAEKLGHLMDVGHLFMKNVLVSHPHGKSKRISVGDDDWSEYIVVTIPNETSVQLKTGTKIRFSGCQDTARRVVQDINCLPDKRVNAFDDESKTFYCDYDLTVVRALGVQVETKYRDFFDREGGKQIRKKEVWCDIFVPGTQIVADGENRYTFPHNDDNVPRVRMEVLVKTELFFDKKYENKHSVFTYRRHNMASCPGSSGAFVGRDGHDDLPGLLGCLHFGSCVDFNTSSLDCIHTPDGQDTKTPYKYQIGEKWYQDESPYRPKLYDLITGK